MCAQCNIFLARQCNVQPPATAVPALADAAERHRVTDDGDKRLRTRDGRVQKLDVAQEAVVHDVIERAVAAARVTCAHRAEEDDAKLLACGTMCQRH